MACFLLLRFQDQKPNHQPSIASEISDIDICGVQKTGVGLGLLLFLKDFLYHGRVCRIKLTILSVYLNGIMHFHTAV